MVAELSLWSWSTAAGGPGLGLGASTYLTQYSCRSGQLPVRFRFRSWSWFRWGVLVHELELVQVHVEAPPEPGPAPACGPVPPPEREPFRLGDIGGDPEPVTPCRIYPLEVLVLGLGLSIVSRVEIGLSRNGSESTGSS